ncbi:MAG: hypothetical protein IJ358_03150 [Clostridia bacterium]|nr:hypothetical protein [Clostridia bacterium]
MQLTERQCWKVIRGLVTAKNDEYSKFLGQANFDVVQKRQILGYTRDAFLRQFGLSSVADFFDEYVRSVKAEPNRSRWLENLSSESLLLFLDFRCRILQSLYDNYYRIKSADNVKQIVDGVKVSKLSAFNGGRLIYSSKPKRVAGEKKLSELNLSQNEISELALLQTMDSIAQKYATRFEKPIHQVLDLAYNLHTSNVDDRGFVTGYRLKSKIEFQHDAPKPPKSAPTISKDKEKPIRLVGYDEYRNHVFIKNGQYVSIMGEPIPYVNIVYDKDGNEIVAEEYEDDASKGKFIGVDIQGTPVYDVDGEYYTSTGKRLPDDVFIDNTQDDTFGV